MFLYFYEYQYQTLILFWTFKLRFYVVGFAISSELHVYDQTPGGSGIEKIPVERMLIVRICYHSYVCYSVICFC